MLCSFRIPAHVSLEAAALLEPLSVAIHATKRATIEQGDTAVVFGAGTVGLLVAAMAKLSGATTVVIADLDAGRVNYALQNGFATKGYIVSSRKQQSGISDNFAGAKEISSDVLEIAGQLDPEFEGADVTFDCTGKEVCMQAGLYVSISNLIPIHSYPPIHTILYADQLPRQPGPAANSSWSEWAHPSKPSPCLHPISKKSTSSASFATPTLTRWA